ncbi:MAG: c-type cytochrome [Pyrinomonadaceae bacterium]
MRTRKISILAAAALLLPVLATAFFAFGGGTPVVKADDDVAAVYKAKCAACHAATAAKFYNPEMEIDEQVTAILKGKKGAKPPFMPAFETKGIDEAQAKALAEYMKQLRTPADGQ